MASELKRKSIHFDFDTKMLKKYFTNYTTGYEKMKRILLKQGFEHVQGSGYNSIMPLSNIKVLNVVKSIIKENPWVIDCSKDFAVANLEEANSLVSAFMRKQKAHQNSTASKVVLHDDDELERD